MLSIFFFKDNGKLFKTTIWLLYSYVIFISLLLLVAGLLYLLSLLSSELMSLIVLAFVFGVYGLLFLKMAVSIAFMVTFYQTYTNLKRVTFVKHDTSWTVIAWFLPIVRYILPVKIIKDYKRQSEKIMDDKGIEVSDRNWNKTIHYWLVLFIVSTSLTINTLLPLLQFLDTSSNFYFSLSAMILAELINIPLAFITISLLRKMQKREVELHQLQEIELNKMKASRLSNEY